jgi:hypothetical protein
MVLRSSTLSFWTSEVCERKAKMPPGQSTDGSRIAMGHEHFDEGCVENE